MLKDAFTGAIVGFLLACAVIYMVTHPSTCRWEESCE